MAIQRLTVSRLLSSRVVAYVAVAIGLTIVAIGGVALGRLIRSESEHSMNSPSAISAIAVDSMMASVDIGTRLLDWNFEALNGDTVQLSVAVKQRRRIAFVDPSCGTCVEKLVSTSSERARSGGLGDVILISSGNPIDLIRLSRTLAPQTVLLYDRDGTYLSYLKIPVLPFTIVVDDSLTIVDLIPESL